MSKCPFCGADELVQDTPFLEPVTHQPKKQFCCKAQERNQSFIDKKFHSIYGTDNKPDLEEASKL